MPRALGLKCWTIPPYRHFFSCACFMYCSLAELEMAAPSKALGQGRIASGTKEDQDPLFPLGAKWFLVPFQGCPLVWTSTVILSDCFVLGHPQYVLVLRKLYREIQYGRERVRFVTIIIVEGYAGWGVYVLLWLRSYSRCKGWNGAGLDLYI